MDSSGLHACMPHVFARLAFGAVSASYAHSRACSFGLRVATRPRDEMIDEMIESFKSSHL